MNKNGFSRCADIYIGRLREEGRYSTAHVYQNALLSFSKFCGVHSVSSVKSPVSVFAVTNSTFTNVV